MPNATAAITAVGVHAMLLLPMIAISALVPTATLLLAVLLFKPLAV